MTAPLPQLIGGRYERVRRLASGGMATVYLGRTVAVGVGDFERPVAIKAMHPHLAKDAEFVAMFLDEVKLAASIRHANVVATLDAIRDETGLFLVMDYVEGLALSDLMKAARRLERQIPVPIALRIISDALAGLHAAHELTTAEGRLLNVVHRDVSPHNVLVGIDGTARITDFGIARAEARRSATTHTGVVKGKTAYMSLEQLAAKPLDRRADVYAAGILLWELLAGRRLFEGDNEVNVALVAARGASEAPHDVATHVPRPISLACMKALARDPAQRWSTAAAFADALDDAAAASNLSAARPKEVGRLVVELRAEHEPPASSRRPEESESAPLAGATPSVNAEGSFKTAHASAVSVRRTHRPRHLLAIAAPAAAVGVGMGFLLFSLVTPSPDDPPSAALPASASPLLPAPPALALPAPVASASTARPAPPPAQAASPLKTPARPASSSTTKKGAKPKPDEPSAPFRPDQL